ncbi:F-box/kelch-repeat protein [Acorus gramineus]|uniref:F-box/kelch-repeat protein n=1 Tax=Acorus gramineus TaxID=55184 RepID=A0AAV9AS55_ACOGR|nr:F-box/kelch-repeat protein [Acorus gramineus]
MEVELIPGLPSDMAMECLIRLSYKWHHVARRVSKRWRNLIDGGDLYRLRKQSGKSSRLACLVQSLPTPSSPALDAKPSHRRTAYGLSVFDPDSYDWDLLPPIPTHPDGLPLFCQVAGAEGRLVVLGGWDPVSWEPLRDVWVYDFRLGSWRRGTDMPCARSFFAVGAVRGVVFVAGGHDASKNAMRTASAYDVGRDAWVDAGEMGEGRDECEGVVVKGEVWVVGGYGTERQGRFGGSAEVLDVGKGRWRRVEGAWVEGRCPRGCVGEGKDGGLVCWSDEEQLVRVGTCAVRVGDRVVLTGSVCPGAPHGVFSVKVGGKNERLEAVDVPREFSGFVQSGCCVEM